MLSNDRVRVFKRLETDEEFRKRIEAAKGYVPHYTGQLLDDDAWKYYRMQRRIVEDQR